MRRYIVTDGITLALVLAVGGCNNNSTGITVSERFAATLSAANERPADSSTATGTATFTYLADVGAIFYRLDVKGIDSAFAAHIHAPADTGSNAAVVVGLFAGPTTGLGFTGELAQGVLVVPTGMSQDSLLVLLRNGHAYVNVHTRGPVNATTHSGGHPGGEIRGQVVKQ
jgi:hypothetical protein